MNRLLAVALVLTATAASAVSAQTLPPKPPRLAMNTATAYVVAASTGDLYEVQSAQIALEKSQDPAVRALATALIKHHGRSTNSLTRAAKASKVTMPAPTLDAGHAASIAELQAAAPADFDRLFLAQQVAAHTQALAMHQSFFDNGDKTPLREVAKAQTSPVRKHLDAATKLQASKGA